MEMVLLGVDKENDKNGTENGGMSKVLVSGSD
jgi:hypothetical protein